MRCSFIISLQVSYQQLVDKFYENHDPTTLNRQKGDAGTQYRSGIYYRSEAEKQARLLLNDMDCDDPYSCTLSHRSSFIYSVRSAEAGTALCIQGQYADAIYMPPWSTAGVMSGGKPGSGSCGCSC